MLFPSTHMIISYRHGPWRGLADRNRPNRLSTFNSEQRTPAHCGALILALGRLRSPIVCATGAAGVARCFFRSQALEIFCNSLTLQDLIPAEASPKSRFLAAARYT